MPFCFLGDIHGHVMMISPVRGWAFIHINASVEKNCLFMGDFLAAHDHNGCNTIATTWHQKMYRSEDIEI